MKASNKGNRPDEPRVPVDKRTREVMAVALHLASRGDLGELASNPDLPHLTAALGDLPAAFIIALDDCDLDPFSTGPITTWPPLEFVNTVRDRAREIRGDAPTLGATLTGVGPVDEQGVRSTGIGAAVRSDPDRELLVRRRLAVAEAALLSARPYKFVRAIEELSEVFDHGRPSPSLFIDELERLDELAQTLALSDAARERLGPSLEIVSTLLEAAHRGR